MTRASRPAIALVLPTALSALLLSTAPSISAQGVISGRALLQNSTRPLACADATLRRSDGTVVARTFIREDGTFEYASPAPGRYVVAFSTLGMVEAVAELDSLHPGSDVDRTFTVPLIPVDSLVERVSAARGDKRYAQLASSSATPRYPAAERTGGREGGVVAAVVVSADGRVDTVLTSILYASAEPFEASVRESFAQMRFEPAEVEGQARCSLLVLPYIFDLAANAAPLPVEQRGPCPPLPVPSDGTLPVYLVCQVDRPAREIRSTAVLRWDPSAEAQSNSCFRAEIRFVVDTLGVPELATLSLVSTNNRGYGRAVIAMAPDLRYSPARLDGRPVRQILTHRESDGLVRVTTVDGGSRAGSATPTRATRC